MPEKYNTISQLITGVFESLNAIVTDTASIQAVIEEVNNIVTNIASAIEEQSVTTREITRHLSESNDQVSRNNVSMQSVKNAAAVVAEDSQATRDLSTDIMNISSRLKNSSQYMREMSDRISDLVKRFDIK